jgi:hypothetical protein
MTTEQQQSAIFEKWVNRILLGICAFFCAQLFADMKTQRNDIEQVKLSNARIETEIKYIREMVEPNRNNKDLAKHP